MISSAGMDIVRDTLDEEKVDEEGEEEASGIIGSNVGSTVGFIDGLGVGAVGIGVGAVGTTIKNNVHKRK